MILCWCCYSQCFDNTTRSHLIFSVVHLTVMLSDTKEEMSKAEAAFQHLFIYKLVFITSLIPSILKTSSYLCVCKGGRKDWQVKLWPQCVGCSNTYDNITILLSLPVLHTHIHTHKQHLPGGLPLKSLLHHWLQRTFYCKRKSTASTVHTYRYTQACTVHADSRKHTL